MMQGTVERVSFGLFEADLRSGELWKAGHKVRLPRQPFRVLATLLLRSGDIVNRAELQEEIWGANTNVDYDQALAAAVNKIREALGDSAENPRFVQTLPKRGYRFIAPVTQLHSLPEREPTLASSPPVVREVTTEAVIVGESAFGEVEPSPPVLPLPLPFNREPGMARPDISAPAGSPELYLLPLDRALRDVRAQRTASISKGRIWSTVLIVAAVLAGVTVGRFVLQPAPHGAPFRSDQVTHYTAISKGPPNPESFLEMAADDDRVFTSVMVDGRPRLSTIEVNTGDVQPIAVPDEISFNALTDISKDGSKLLLREQSSAESEQPLWVIPSSGGSGLRITGVLAHDAAWMPDGNSILYANGNELAEVGPSGDKSTVYASLPGRAFWLRWSPDGQLLRFTLFDPVTHATALWEMESGDHVAKPVSLPAAAHLSPCCGVWLADGQSYIFQANDNLWQLHGDGSRARLTQLTNGPLRSLFPVAARSGQRVFYLGLEAPSGLQQFDPTRKEFRSAPSFLADANRISYTEDGRWVAWTDTHEKLWRARVDGSDKVRLTSDALEVFLAQWAPDGKRLAVMARRPGGVWQIYLVDASGSKTEVLLGEARNAADPSWSSDGTRLVYGREPDLMGKESGLRNLQTIDLATGRVAEIPGSEGLFSPRWSPDGRWIIALTLDQQTVMLYDVSRREWKRLASTSAADPVWSTDSGAIYVHAFLADREPVVKIAVPSGEIQTIADLGDFHDVRAANYFFGGITPKGEPLVQPRVGTGELYMLSLKNP